MKKNENIKIRKTKTEVKGVKITFDEYYRVDQDTGEEIFDRELEIQNDLNLYDIYKKQKGLLTISEIKDIRKKYDMNQKEYAMAVGMGEVTVNRFENGAIQTEATDAIMRLSEDPDNMYELMCKNHTNMPEATYNSCLKKINKLRELKFHKIAKIDEKELNNMQFDTEKIDKVSDKIIEKYNKKNDVIYEQYNVNVNCEYITPLKLQKLLYYVQGIAIYLFNKPAFVNDIKAWSYGPVVEEIYYKYKTRGQKSLPTPKKSPNVSEGLEKIIDIVVEDYGKYNAGALIDMTHNEDPWKYTSQNDTISLDSIKQYFDEVYGN